jgi:PleD family two-component response regulator
LLVRVRALPHGIGPLLSFSAGVTEYRRDEAMADTVARADHEMYEAKQSGRNTVRLQ